MHDYKKNQVVASLLKKKLTVHLFGGVGGNERCTFLKKKADGGSFLGKKTYETSCLGKKADSACFVKHKY